MARLSDMLVLGTSLPGFFFFFPLSQLKVEALLTRRKQTAEATLAGFQSL